tara:strand:+ start:106 stop:315 length:210 start_codon:yes stop_codon:yes gene_type:complete
MNKVKRLNTFKHITFVTSVLLGMASVFTFIDGGRSTFGMITGGTFWAVLSISYLACYFHVNKLLNVASK